MVLPRFPAAPGRRLDVAGWASIGVGLFALLLGLSEGERWHWDSYGVRLLLVLGVLSLALFVVIELSTDEPLLDLRVFRSRTYTVAAILVALLSNGLFAALFFIPLFLQQGQGLGAFETGLTMLPPALVTVVMMPLSGWLYDRIGARWPAAVGTLLLATSTYLMHGISVSTSRGQFMLWLAIRNLGMGMAFMPIVTVSLSAVPAHLVSRASAINNIVQRVASAFGLAILGAVLTRHEAQQFADRAALLPAVDPGFPLLQQIASQGPRGLLYLYNALQLDVFANALGDVFLLTAGLTALGVPLALLLPERRRRRRDVSSA
jgi:EmrB/QacA subfamily drug resistance transporter